METECESCLVAGMHVPATGHSTNPEWSGYDLCAECVAEYDGREPVCSTAPDRAGRGVRDMVNTYTKHNTAHLGVTRDRYCELPDTFDLKADADNPHTYLAYAVNEYGRRLSETPIRVKVDHDATGTHTPGTGDTVVRRV